MSNDGAQQGIRADQALNVILGGQPEAEQEHDDDDTVRARVLAASETRREATDYSDAADIAAGLVLRFYAARPDAVTWPGEPTYEWRVPGGQWARHYPKGAERYEIESRTVGPDLYHEVNEFFEGRLSDLGVTGFQWGWAVNCAKHLMGAPPVPNPAIMVIGDSNDV